jgi:hypothetical protein
MLKRHRRCIERASALGAAGKLLLQMLPSHVPSRFVDMGLSRQANYVLGGAGSRCTFQQRIALSLLACDVPIQVRSKSRDVARLVDLLVPALPRCIPAPLYLGKSADGEPTYAQGAFGSLGAKANLRFGDVYRDVQKHEPGLAKRYHRLSGFTSNFNDAQATAALLYGCCIDGAIRDPIGYAIRIVSHQDAAKNVNTIIKGTGLNATHAGAILCEALSLRGRGEGGIDLVEKARERVERHSAEATLPKNINIDALRAHVRKVIELELSGKRVVFPTQEAFWSSRWLWAVNGGHSATLSRLRPEYAVPLKGRVHRRAALECWEHNPIPSWDGSVSVSVSPKYEHGKTRFIMACDTISYVAFEHLLRPIEQAWRNSRVLLDPGRLGHGGMAKRVLKLGEKGGSVWVMLDYDDFNTQHSLKAQSLVVEELVRATDYPADLGATLIDSFHKMDVYVGPNKIGRAAASLMSGHRGTTILNSILNAAYIRYGMGAAWDHTQSLHTGDDVVMAVKTFTEADRLVKSVLGTGVRMNPMKQSIGSCTAEFLRMAIAPKGARGYLARSIASAISGSWTNSNILGSDEAVRTFAQGARTIINRSGKDRAYLFLCTSMRRRTGLGNRAVRGILSGTIAVGDGPCFAGNNRYQALVMEAVSPRGPEDERLSGLLAHATIQYLGEHASPVEQTALEMAKVRVKRPMLLASYAKTLGVQDDSVRLSQWRMRLTEKVAARGLIDSSELFSQEAPKGVFSWYPLLAYLRKALTYQNVVDLLRLAGQEVGADPMLTAWGADARGVVIQGTTSYSDACSYCRRTTVGVVRCAYPVAM